MTRNKSSGWAECSRERPCGGCGHTDGWCSVSADGAASLCRRGAESPYPVKQRDGSVAYMHPLTGKARGAPVAAKLRADRLTPAEIRNLLKRHRTALSPKRLATSAKMLGLDESALLKYGAGWDDERGALSFPMYDGNGVPIGIKLRADAGRKMCVPGSASGLFLPDDFDVSATPTTFIEGDRFSPMLLVTPEGPTDCAAAWQVGFTAVGRPSNTGGGPMLSRLLERCRDAGAPREVVVLADADATHWHDKVNIPYWPGWEGAFNLAADVASFAAGVRVIKPPAGAKDVRQILKSPPPEMADDPARSLGTALACAIEAADEERDRFGGFPGWLKFRKSQLLQVKAVCRVSLAGKSPNSADRTSAEAMARELVRTGKAEEWLRRNRLRPD